MPIYANVAAVQKDVKPWYTNIGGAQKQLNSMLGNVSAASKELLAQPTAYWSIPVSSSGTLATNTRTRMVADKVTVNSSGTFTLVNPTSISGRPAAGKYYVSISTTANSTSAMSTTLYYAVNASGGYSAYNCSSFRTSLASISVSSLLYTDDVVYLSGPLYVKKSLVPTIYRWTEYIASANTITGMGDVWHAYNGTISFNTNYVYVSSTLDVDTSDNTKYRFSQQVWNTSDFGSLYSGYYTLGGSNNIDTQAYHITGYSDTTPYDLIQYDGWYSRQETTTTTYSQGYATGYYVYAISTGAYPSNGQSGSYWYNNLSYAS